MKTFVTAAVIGAVVAIPFMFPVAFVLLPIVMALRIVFRGDPR